MGCSVSGDTLQCWLEESVSHRRTRQVTQLFTYLLTHNLFSSCIRRYSVTCLQLSDASVILLLVISFQFSLLFVDISLARLYQHCSVQLI